MRKQTGLEKLINGLESYGNATIYVKNISDEKKLSKSYRFTIEENGAIKVEEILEFFDTPFFNIHGVNRNAKIKRRHILRESTNPYKYIPQIIFSELNDNLVLVNTDLKNSHNKLTSFLIELMLKIDLTDEELSNIMSLYRSKKYEEIIELLEAKKTYPTEINDIEIIKSAIKEKALHLKRYKRNNLYKAKSITNTGKLFEYLKNYGNAILFLPGKADLRSKKVKALEFEITNDNIFVGVRTFIFDRSLFNEEALDLDAKIIGKKIVPDQVHHYLTKKDLIKVIESDFSGGFIKAFKTPFNGSDDVLNRLFNDIYSLINFNMDDMKRIIKYPNTLIKILKEKENNSSSSEACKQEDIPHLIDSKIEAIKNKVLMPDGEQLMLDIRGNKHEKK